VNKSYKKTLTKNGRNSLALELFKTENPDEPIPILLAKEATRKKWIRRGITRKSMLKSKNMHELT